MIGSRTAIGRLHTNRLLGAVVQVFESVRVCLEADRINARSGSATCSRLVQSLDHALHLLVVHGLGAAFRASHVEPIIEAVDADDAVGAEEIGALDRMRSV
jgi:hypothetical protein